MKVTDNTGNCTTDHPRRVLRIDLRTSASSLDGRSRAVKDLQRFDRNTSAGAERVATAVLKGVQRYRKERTKTSKTNGAALRKLPLHMARGMVTGLRRLDGLGNDVERAILSPKLRSKLKKRLRA